MFTIFGIALIVMVIAYLAVAIVVGVAGYFHPVEDHPGCGFMAGGGTFGMPDLAAASDILRRAVYAKT